MNKDTDISEGQTNVYKDMAKDFTESLQHCNVDESSHESHHISDDNSSVNNTNSTVINNETEKNEENSLSDAVEDTSSNECDIECETSDVDEEYLQEKFKGMSETQLMEAKEMAKELKNKGNAYFKEEKYDEAISEYTTALKTCPLSFSEERSVLYANRAACKSKLDDKENAILDCTKALELNPTYLKALLRRAHLYRSVEKLDEALNDYQKVLEIDPGVAEARKACMELPEEINERNEKLKTEMLGKLKDLGNMILRPFGLSTENFNLVKDPNSGGYSVNFQSKR